MGLEQNDQSIIFSSLAGHYYDRHPELTQFIPDTVKLICKIANERGVSITQMGLTPGMDYDNNPFEFEHMVIVVAVNAYHTRTYALRGYLDDEIKIYLGTLTESQRKTYQQCLHVCFVARPNKPFNVLSSIVGRRMLK